MRGLTGALLVFTLLQTNFATPKRGVVHVVLFMHNEDSALGDLEDPASEQRYLHQRQELIKFCSMLNDLRVPYCWQSDWAFLEGVLKYETRELMAGTNGKNLVRYLHEDLNIDIDPHSHENFGYNYADVAHLIDSLGVPPTKVIGGHIWDPDNNRFQEWDRFRQPLQGQRYPWASWHGEIIIGHGTPDHTYDPHPSGVWRPRDRDHFWDHDPAGNVIAIGQFYDSVDSVAALVELYKTGSVSPDKMLTAALVNHQNFDTYSTPRYKAEILDPLLEMQARGEIKLTTFTDLAVIWQEKFAGQPFLYNAPESGPQSNTVSTHIPSTAGGEQGIYVQLTMPDAPRFAQGAPVAIHVTGGWTFFGVSELKSSWNPQGVIDIQFNWPGCDRPGQESGGTYDYRGPNCITALADVARFAMGLLPDKNGHFISDLTGAILPLSENVGMIGWSNGGNATITAAAQLATFTDQLAWIVNWESPVGDGMPTVICGRPENLNPAYDPNSGRFDSTRVSYDPIIDVQGGFTGGLYFDLDDNGLAERRTDWFPTPLTYNLKLYYTEWLRRKAEEMGLAVGSHIATVQETESFWHWRNGENHIQTAVSGHPNLMFIVEAGETDHVQGALDHPHVLNQYLGFIKAGCRFVRLNPDRSMVEAFMGHSMPNATDNDAFADYDHLTIRSALNPRGQGGIPNNIAVGAAVCELVDRTQDSNITPQLDAVSTGIQKQESPPRKFHLEQNFPNPFNHSTTIRFHIAKPGRIHIRLFNLLGHEVKAWNRELKQGEHTLHWDGRDRYGRIVPSGTYFVQMSGDRAQQMLKMQMIR